MKRSVAVALLLLGVTALMWGKRPKKGDHHELCVIKTLAITGNSESATKARQMLAEKTWLKLVAPDKADAVLDVADQRSLRTFPAATEMTTTSFTLTKKDSGEVLWSDSQGWGEGVINSGAGSAVKLLLIGLNWQANCQE